MDRMGDEAGARRYSGIMERRTVSGAYDAAGQEA